MNNKQRCHCFMLTALLAYVLFLFWDTTLHASPAKHHTVLELESPQLHVLRNQLHENTTVAVASPAAVLTTNNNSRSRSIDATTLINASSPICANNVNLSGERQLMTADIFGRLGNNMFEYAGLLGLAKKNHRVPFILPSFQFSRYFKLSHVKSVSNTAKWRQVGEPRYGTYNPHFECLPEGPLMLKCYLQSFKYFEDIYDEIRREFTFQKSIDQEAFKVLNQLHIDNNINVTKVGVHVRRGDKLQLQENKRGDQTAPLSYFHKAFDWMRSKYKNVVFLVASDDVSWSKSNLNGSDVIFLPIASAPVHLSILAKCNHVVMSVGTYGWWAGWLSGGDVIYYDQPYHPKSWKSRHHKMDDVYPKHWFALGK